MFAIQNIKTGKFLYGTDYRYSPCRQRTSKNEMRTYSCLNQAISDYHSRRCGKDYRIVVLKAVEIRRVIDLDSAEGYELQKNGWREETDGD